MPEYKRYNRRLMNGLKQLVLACPEQAYRVLNLGMFPYQGAGPKSEHYGDVRPPLFGTDDPWDRTWTIVAFDGHLWSVMTLPEEIVEILETTV